MSEGAIVIFTKTPGVSPVKTRLAKSVGKETAEEFHRLSVLAIDEIIQNTIQLNNILTPYWAVAEITQLDHALWKNFKKVFQGEGCLGTRLATVYTEMLKSYQFVILIGTDSPQISPNLLTLSASYFQNALNHSCFVMGPAYDGGFYLFAGNKSLSPKIWKSIPYSQHNTARLLKQAVQNYGKLIEIPQQLDVDTVDNLVSLQKILSRQALLLPKQKDLLAWIDIVFK